MYTLTQPLDKKKPVGGFTSFHFCFRFICSFKENVFHAQIRTHVRLLGPCYKTGLIRPFNQFFFPFVSFNSSRPTFCVSRKGDTQFCLKFLANHKWKASERLAGRALANCRNGYVFQTRATFRSSKGISNSFWYFISQFGLIFASNRVANTLR